MRKTLLVLLLAASTVSAAGPRVTVGRANWQDYRPNDPFQVGLYYLTPYTEVIYVRQAVTLSDGTVYFVIENVRGRWCQDAKACLIPAETPRGPAFEVAVTLTPVAPTR